MSEELYRLAIIYESSNAKRGQLTRPKNPFSERENLVSLASGCVGDSTTNCIAAVACGQLAMSKMIGKNFGDVKLKRTDKVRSLASLNSGIT